VSLTKAGETVTLEIRDTGLGYDAATGAEGLGSKLMVAFARQLAADFTTEARPGQGTTHRLVMEL
jgi:nitrate/nitrite-specific signal transduction histidine kinase